MEGKKHLIYKTVNRYSEEEFNSFVKEMILDDEELISDSDEAIDKAKFLINEYFYDDFGEQGNVYFTPSFNNRTYVINGVLGLWDGPHTIKPVKYETFLEAVDRCVLNRDIEDFEIYEEDGEFNILAYHHDGCNHFKISHELADGTLEPAYFRKHVFGCED